MASMGDEPVRPNDARRLYQVVADRIRDLIRSGEFPRASRLPAERELAQRLGVSRPSLREALIALEIEGTVAVRMGSGITVTSRGPDTPAASLGDSPTEIMGARIAIEGAVTVAACARMNAQTLETLRATITTMHHAVRDGGVPLAADRAFHIAIAEQGGNSVLARLVGQLFDERKGSILSRLSRKFDTPATWRAAEAEHEAILAALAAADPLRAEAAMRHHLQCSAERWLGD
jgi:GntR family transcriptional regulator, transcriptional repressor for pyruvate dehydrogenase complex